MPHQSGSLSQRFIPKLWMCIGVVLCLQTAGAASAQSLPSVDELFSTTDEVDAEAKDAAAPVEVADDAEAEPEKRDEANAAAPTPAVLAPKEEAAPIEAVGGLPPAKLEVIEPAAATIPAPTQRPELAAPSAQEAPAQDDAAQDEPSSYRQLMPAALVKQIFEEIQRDRALNVYDLRPYVSDDEWSLAIESFEADKCTDALRHARKATDAIERPHHAILYMIARMQLCSAKEAAQGKETLALLAKQDDGVGLLARRALGLSTPDLGAMMKSSSKAKAEDASHESIYKRMLSLGKAKKTWEQAVEGLEQLRAVASRGSDWYKYTLAKAEVMERHGDIEGAGRLWVGMFLRTRGWRTAKDVERSFLAFERRHKLDLQDLSVRLDTLRALVEEGEFKQAKKLSGEIAKFAKITGKELKGWTLYRQALEAERRRDRSEAADLFAKADALIEDPVMRPRLYYAWARALRRLDKDLEAVKLYKRLCAEFPHERELCAESLYQAGRLLQYENKFDEAFDAFFMLAGFYPEADRMVEVHWRAALCAYLLGRYEESASLWSTVEERWPEEIDSAGLPMGLRARYWRGVVALKAGDRLEGVALLHQALGMGPLTWYGRLAAARLKQLNIEPPTGLPLHRYTLADTQYLEGLAIPRDPRFQMAEPLIRLGLAKEALAEVQRYAWRSPQPEGASALIASLLHANGEFDRAHWMAQRNLKLSGPTADTFRLWAASYPLAYIEHVHQYAQKYGVSPMLVLAIMRQESGFRPKVKSYAGALGLMQLMPGTARYTAKVFLEDDGYRAKQIFEPETNIRLGTMYIRVHTAYAADRLPLALAGYNAGPAPLKRWFEEYKDRELDAWVESITFTQARGYVRKVMTSYIAYSALYGDGRLPELELDLPKSLGKWGKIPEVSIDAVSALDSVELEGGDEVVAWGGAHGPDGGSP